MNDDKDMPLNPIGDDALEARIVAWVLGEASSFEAAELEKLCAEDPALRLFERRLRVLHGLIGENLKAGPDAEWKLPEAKRAKITDLLGVEPHEAARIERSTQHFARRALLALAACAVLGFVSYSLIGGVGEKAAMKESVEIVDMVASGPAAESMAPEFRGRAVGPTERLSRDEVNEQLESRRRQLAEPSISDSKKQSVFNEYKELEELKAGFAEVEAPAEALAMQQVPASPASPQTAPAAKPRSSPESESELQALRPSAVALADKDIVTGGNRSGDGAINRNNIDATLNNPNRVAGGKSEASAGSLPGWASLDEAAKSKFADPLSLEQEGQVGGYYSGYDAGKNLQSTSSAIEAASAFFKQSEPQQPQAGLAGEGAGDVDRIRRNLYTAEGHYNLGKYDDAHRAYEEVLRTDPYNKAARRGMEQVAMARSDYYRAAYDQTRAQLLAEVDKAWELSVPPVDAPATPAEPKPAAPALQETPKPPVIEPTAEITTAAEPFSTFSLHVSDASFKLAKAALDRGEIPAADGIRPEEFYNAFDYGDPSPASGEPVVCAVEQSAHPAFPQRNLLRVGIKTGSQGRGQSTPLNLTLLLDNSGSMEREDRHAGLANAVRQLSGLLKEGDTITVAGFSRQPRLLADRLPGARAQELNGLIAQTPAEGGTNLEEGLKLGEELAKRQFNPAAQNRVVLFTDGAANLGDARPEALQARVEGLRQQGIAFDAAGFGADGLNDKLLERLTRNGNGRYYIVDRPEDADAGFAKQLAGAFRPAAENVKVQVRFNPARVAKYKLIGFEEHRLQKEDFRNDAVDAAEMAAEEAGNALYQIEVLPQGEGEVGEVSVRFRDAASGQMVERTWTIPYESQAPAFDQAKPSIQLAGLAAFAAEKLRSAPMAEAIDLQQLAPVLAKVKARYPNSQPVADLGAMIGKLK